MKKLMNIILLFALILIVGSCSFLKKFDPEYWKMKSEFKKELELVEKILDYPDNIQEIIESSEFYDKNRLNINIDSYKTYKVYLKPDDGDIEIYSFGYTTLSKNKGEIKNKDAKIVEVYNEGAQYRLGFVFIDLENKTILVEIWSIV
jgi:hypothetical protein